MRLNFNSAHMHAPFSHPLPWVVYCFPEPLYTFFPRLLCSLCSSTRTRLSRHGASNFSNEILHLRGIRVRKDAIDENGGNG